MNYLRQDLNHVIVLFLTKAKPNLLINRKYYIEVKKILAYIILLV